MKEYKKRTADQILSDKLESFGAVLISSAGCFQSSRVQPLDSLFLTVSKECQPDSNRRKPLADTSSSASIWDPLR